MHSPLLFGLPAEHEYGDLRLRDMLMSNVAERFHLWPKDATGVEVAAYAHCVITARGTSAIEYTANGMRVLVGAPTDYTPFNFAPYASTEEEYVTLLKSVATQPLPSDKQIEDARIYAALFLADNDKGATELRFPYSTDGDQLYNDLPEFISRNKDRLEQEISLMKEWVESGHSRFNTWKRLTQLSRHSH